MNVDPFTLTGGRTVGTVAALVALSGVIVGALALLRPRRGSRRAPTALVAGLIGVLAGGLVIAVADGGPGTGNGVVGGYAGLVIGLIAVALGGPAWARSRRSPG